MDVSVVALASRGVALSMRSRDLLVSSRSMMLVYFLLVMATSGLLSVLVALVALVVLAAVTPSGVGSSSWGATGLGGGAHVTFRS
jgi:hypothetical protein